MRCVSIQKVESRMEKTATKFCDLTLPDIALCVGTESVIILNPVVDLDFFPRVGFSIPYPLELPLYANFFRRRLSSNLAQSPWAFFAQCSFSTSAANRWKMRVEREVRILDLHPQELTWNFLVHHKSQTPSVTDKSRLKMIKIIVGTLRRTPALVLFGRKTIGTSKRQKKMKMTCFFCPTTQARFRRKRK